jgi:hypothetical protein
MTEAGIGRLLVASLHQGIAEVLPDRLEFYENWLNPEGLRKGGVGLAAVNAVLSFLRCEDDYDRVVARAGEYAAEWSISVLPAAWRRVICALPRWARYRMASRLIAGMVRSTYGGSRAVVRLRGGGGTMVVRASVFCAVRGVVASPLCAYYSAAATRVLVFLDLAGEVRIEGCRATGAAVCAMRIASAAGTLAGVATPPVTVDSRGETPGNEPASRAGYDGTTQ